MGETGNNIGDRRALAAGETLFLLGDEGDVVFELLDGQLEVVSPTEVGELVVARLGPGEIVGEIAAVIGRPRSATVRATEPTVVRPIERDAFIAEFAGDPEASARVARQARERLERTRVVQVLAGLLGPGHDEVVAELADSVTWVRLEAGSTLFEQGDVADAAYVLASGRMRVTAVDDGVTTLDRLIGRGDLLGEIGIVEQAPRSASAKAERDCSLARLGAEEFQAITARHPELMLPLVRKVLSRITDRHQRPMGARSITLVATCELPSAFTDTLLDEVRSHGDVAWFDAERAADISRTWLRYDEGLGWAKLAESIHEADVANRWVLLFAEGVDDEYSRLAVRSADRIVVITSSSPSAAEFARIDAVRELTSSLGEEDIWHASIRPPGGTREGSGALRQRTGAIRSLSLGTGDERSVRRAARLITGTATGVALGGGGARSFAHVGALRALLESGIEVDAIAGTSMGAVVAAYYALCADIDETQRAGRETFTGTDLLDLTLPVASIYGGRRINQMTEERFGTTDMEDAEIPLACLSTNLTQGELVIHRTGRIGHAVRASTSLPGVFPPVADDGELLVDGGVLENLPVSAMLADPAVERIVAIDVTPPDGLRAPENYGSEIGVGTIARRYLGRTDARWPRLSQTLMGSMLVGSLRARRDVVASTVVDLYLSLNLKGVKLLDFDAYDRAIERGYAEAQPAIQDWLDETEGRTGGAADV